MELGLLLPLLGEHTGSEWQLADTGRADAAMVDTDADGAAEAVAVARDAAVAVITVSGGESNGCELHVTRPLRTHSLVRVLAAAARADDASRQPSGPEPDAVAYRLLRWPGTETLRREWRLTRVCGALGRGPQTRTEIAARAGLAESELERLIGLLDEVGCIRRTEPPGRPVEDIHSAPPRGLLGRIRARLVGG